MPGIGDQRRRVAGVAVDRFDDDEGCVERNSDRKGRAEIRRRMNVPGMSVTMSMVMPLMLMISMVVSSIVRMRHAVLIQAEPPMFCVGVQLLHAICVIRKPDTITF